ncbi:hypothetical protein PDIG_30240 [Penicillium digitatum PHI26]|uniref:Uncharacterized protein n=2 Tax=Penicillium digitatum TaxID=36651 RepID=K9FZ30_PEND2|nr:hypothetical protein PDIP_64620 [Penicillium digitatum Pd1]EKV09380.1 hypothetical protein PDIP_64620 [Penicillium digitatum Pd1]EKV14945.1 hypothetical protein PDIG_30240 [Penicillium digitatum PHI26]
MASDVSAGSNSTMAQSRPTTSAPTMASQAPTPRQPVHGPHIFAALPPPGSPPLGTGDYRITRTVQVLEKEQEAMVNRLTRELSILRQQTASVASTTSSTSTFNEADGARASPTLSSSAPSHSARRNRSNSSHSSHSSANQGPQSASVTGIAPSREILYRPTDHTRTVRSREPSVTSRRPSIGSLSSFSHNNNSVYPYRNSASQNHPGYSPGSSLTRFEEATHHRLEVEYMKRENEQLRRRVRDLEQTLKRQREGSASKASATLAEKILDA